MRKLFRFLLQYLSRNKAMPDAPEFTNSVAGALCMLAVQPWARNYEDHIALAAGAYDACMNGFLNVEVSDAAQRELINTIKQCAKRGGK